MAVIAKIYLIFRGKFRKKILLTISRDSFDVDEMKQKIINIVNNRTLKELLYTDKDDKKNTKAKIRKKLKSELIRASSKSHIFKLATYCS